MKDQEVFELLSSESKELLRKLNPKKRNLKVLKSSDIIKVFSRNDTGTQELFKALSVSNKKSKKILIKDWINFAYYEAYLNGFETIEKYHLMFAYLLLIDIEKYYMAKKLVYTRAGVDVDLSEQTLIQDLTEASTKISHAYLGREKEMTKLIVNLSSQNEDRPTLLLGESGTGKTGLMLELARRITEGQVPANLVGTKILRIRFGALLNSFSNKELANMQGDIFSRLFSEILSTPKYSGNIILFLDDLRIGTNLFVTFGPINKREGMTIVGAAQNDLNEKFWESPFSKAWNIITMDEQSDDEYFSILSSYATQLESSGNIKFSKEVIQKIIDLYKDGMIPEGMPGEGIKLLEQLAIYKRHKAVDYTDLSDEMHKYQKSTKNQTASNGARLEKKIVALEKMQIEIEPKDLIEYVDAGEAEKSLTQTTIDKKRIINLESTLKTHITGQDQAVEALARALRISSLKLVNESRPVGTFLFLGPTGVGKTETAKVLSRALYGSFDKNKKLPVNFLRIDMTEYTEKHSVSKLFGAPPGYIGYEDNTSLADFLMLNPNSVVLFDEIEKAHTAVLNSLLHIMDEGEIKNNKRETASLEEAIIIMTSNLGAELINQQSIGYLSKASTDWQKKLQDNLKHKLKPEFLNRFDEIIVFNKLNKKSVEEITTTQINILRNKLKEINIKLTISSKSFDKLISEANTEEYGAREVRRVVRKNITDNISKLLLEKSDIKEINIDSIKPLKISSK